MSVRCFCYLFTGRVFVNCNPGVLVFINIVICVICVTPQLNNLCDLCYTAAEDANTGLSAEAIESGGKALSGVVRVPHWPPFHTFVWVCVGVDVNLFPGTDQ